MNISSTAALFAIVFAVLFVSSAFLGMTSVLAVVFLFGMVSLLGVVTAAVAAVAYAVESKQSRR